MTLTEKIKHIFRSTGKDGYHAALSIKEVIKLIPDANSKSVGDIICRLKRQGHLESFYDNKTGIRYFVVNIDILHATRLEMLIHELNKIKEEHGDDLLIHEFTPVFHVVDDGDINYISLLFTK